MPAIKVQITRIADGDQPGFVESQFVDARNRIQSLIEKLPIVTSAEGVIECEVLGRSADEVGEIVTVDTERPWGVESTAGSSRFEVRPSILIE